MKVVPLMREREMGNVPFQPRRLGWFSSSLNPRISVYSWSPTIINTERKEQQEINDSSREAIIQKVKSTLERYLI